jgi:hypothetical protein
VDAISKLDCAKWLWLVKAEQLGIEAVRLSVHETESSATFWRALPYAVPVQDLLKPGPSNVVGNWALTFKDVIAYAIQNEMYYSINEGGDFTGRRLRKYSNSKFLNYMASAIAVHDCVAPPAVHYSLVMDDVVVDVIARRPPEVVELDNDVATAG